MSEVQTESEVYVIYSPGSGYVTGRTHIRFVKDFVKARIYGRACDAENSLKHWGGAKDKPAYVIPVKVILDPKQLFKTVLSGKNA